MPISNAQTYVQEQKSLRLGKKLFWIMGFVILLDLADLTQSVPILKVGFSLSAFDIFSFILAALAFKAKLSLGYQSNADRLLIFICILSLVQVLRGLSSFGVSAGNNFRQDFLVLALACCIAFSRTKPNLREYMSLLGFVACFYLIFDLASRFGFVLDNPFVRATSIGRAYGNLRFVPAHASMFYILLGISGFLLILKGPRKWRSFSVIGLVFTSILFAVMSHNRSVWVVAILGWAAFLYLDHRLNHLFNRILILGLFFGVLILYFVWIGEEIGLLNISSAFDEILEQRSTLAWRIQGWESLASKMSFLNYLIGNGYGANLTRRIFDGYTSVTPHNQFIDVIWKNGLLGLFLYAFLFVKLISGLMKQAKTAPVVEDSLLAFILVLSLVMLALYYGANSHWLPTSLVLGYAIRVIRFAEVTDNEMKTKYKQAN